MKSFSAEALSALASGDVMVSGAVRLNREPNVVRLWGGYGAQVINGEVYLGVGDSGLVSVSAGALGANEQGAELTLSGVDPDVAGTLNLKILRGQPAVLYRLIFNGTGARLLHTEVYLRGRIDRTPIKETPGGASTITIGVEGAARGLGRRSERMRTDADQRQISPTDGGMRRVAFAADKAINWGGKPPERAGGAFGGKSSPSLALEVLAAGRINL